MTATNLARRGPRYISLVAVLAPDLFGLLEFMRYESAYPTTEAESHKILELAEHKVDDAIVRLWMVAPSDRAPDVARRRSFGVRLLGQWHPDDSPPNDERLEHLAKLARAGALL